MPDDDGHELTEDEVRAAFLDNVWNTIEYWEKLPETADGPKTVRDRISGAVFSVLVALDGGCMALPKFIVAPDPHPEDREYHQEHGDDWYPENHGVEVTGDLAGSLHELFHSHDPQNPDTEHTPVEVSESEQQLHERYHHVHERMQRRKGDPIRTAHERLLDDDLDSQ